MFECEGTKIWILGHGYLIFRSSCLSRAIFEESNRLLSVEKWTERSSNCGLIRATNSVFWLRSSPEGHIYTCNACISLQQGTVRTNIECACWTCIPAQPSRLILQALEFIDHGKHVRPTQPLKSWLQANPEFLRGVTANVLVLLHYGIHLSITNTPNCHYIQWCSPLSWMWSFFYRKYFLKHSLCPPFFNTILNFNNIHIQVSPQKNKCGHFWPVPWVSTLG